MSNNRIQVDKRILFTKEQKREMLKKSKYRCCHCGKRIDIGNDFSAEHVIPISKGGTNNADNLIALCNRCNLLKGNMIYNPEHFYKFLNPKDLKVLVDNLDQYLDKFEWFNRYNLFPYDVMYFDHLINVRIHGKKLIGNNKDGLELARENFMTRKMVLKKAIDNEWYSDFYRLFDFVKKYNEKYEIPTDGLKGMLDRVINYGCCYYLTSETSDDILMMIPITVEDVNHNRVPTIHIKNILTFKDSYAVAYLMVDIIDELVSGFLEVAEKFDCRVVPFILDVNYKQEKIAEVFSTAFSTIHSGKAKYCHFREEYEDSVFNGLNCLAINDKVEDLDNFNMKEELEKYRMFADDKLSEVLGWGWKR